MNGDEVECPACGGAGGGPFGRAGSAWDVETYECPRCEGTGRVALVVIAKAGLAKTSADTIERPEVVRRGPAKAPVAAPVAQPVTQSTQRKK
jgi:hypothetical protein